MKWGQHWLMFLRIGRRSFLDLDKDVVNVFKMWYCYGVNGSWLNIEDSTHVVRLFVTKYWSLVGVYQEY